MLDNAHDNSPILPMNLQEWWAPTCDLLGFNHPFRYLVLQYRTEPVEFLWYIYPIAASRPIVRGSACQRCRAHPLHFVGGLDTRVLTGPQGRMKQEVGVNRDVSALHELLLVTRKLWRTQDASRGSRVDLLAAAHLITRHRHSVPLGVGTTSSRIMYFWNVRVYAMRDGSCLEKWIHTALRVLGG